MTDDRYSLVKVGKRFAIYDAANDTTDSATTKAKAQERLSQLMAAEERAATTLQERSTPANNIWDAKVQLITIGAPKARAAAPEKQAYRVAVINTRAALVDVHGADCADVKKAAKRHDDEPWFLEVGSMLELSHEYWGDVISDEVDPNSAEGWTQARGLLREFNFLPCCGDLPEGTSPFAGEEKDVAATDEVPPAKTTEVATPEKLASFWVGWRIADVAIARGGTLGAKLAARKPNKVLDRTVRLTAQELVDLVTVADEVAEKSASDGPLLYSATTHRARAEKAFQAM